MRGRILVLTLSVVVIIAGCSSTPEPTEDVTLAYLKIIQGSGSAATQVGWMELRGHEDADGMRSIVSFVMDLDHEIQGYIRSEGRGVKYEDVAPLVANAIDVKRKYHELPKASRAHLVRLILELPADVEVSTTEATVADVRSSK